MSSPSHAYLFLELAAIVYLLGFGAQYLRLESASVAPWLKASGSLVLLWFVVDQIALKLGIWTFPEGGSLHFRLFQLPAEEYLGFFLHTLVCYGLVKRYDTK